MAPVALNAAVIAVSVYFGRRLPEDHLVLYVAWGYVAGSALQFLVQLPRVLQVLPISASAWIGDPSTYEPSYVTSARSL